MKKIGIFVPVYKHRTSELLSNLDNIRKDLDIYIVTQENDPKIEEYNQYVGEKIKLLKTTSTSIFEKREAIRNAAIEMGYDAMIQIDDDILYRGKYICEDSKRETSDSYRALPTTFDVLLDKMIKTADEENADFVSFLMEFYIGFGKPNTISINKGIACGEFVYINCHTLDKFNIHYDTSGKIHEDVDLVVKLLQNDAKCVTIRDYTCLHQNNYLGTINNSTLYSDFDTLYKFILNQYILWHFPMQLAGKKKDKLRMTIPFSKITSSYTFPEADPELLKLCIEQNVSAVKDYILNKNSKNKQ